MKNLSQTPAYVWRLLFAAALVAVMLMTEARAADFACSVQTAKADSWVFARSRYSHDPDTGARVAQYERVAPIEPLPDPRAITSIYSRSRTVLRGADGSTDTYYRVRNSGNGRGGMDAEWERFHDAWRGARTSGGSFQGGFGGGFGPGYGGFPGYGPGFGNGGGFFPGNGFPGNGNVGPGNGGFGPGGRFRPGTGYGPGYGRPDAGWLDPDAADGYRDRRPRTPDREFFNQDFGPREEPAGEETT